jgi:hypothetical protein
MAQQILIANQPIITLTSVTLAVLERAVEHRRRGNNEAKN